MNKILTLGLIICSCQFANASSINNNQNNTNRKNDNNYVINKKINVKNNINNVLTFANSNSKCWFISTFQLFITALNQSDPNSPIRKTNFAKFVNHLKALNDTCHSTYERGEMTECIPNEQNHIINSKHNLMYDRVGKSNVIGYKIDLIDELIIWGTKNDWMYNKKEKNTIESSNKEKITQEEKNRRNDALHLLSQMQDMNTSLKNEVAFSIILNIFPELKQYFGSYLNTESAMEEDILITNANQIELNNETRKYKAIIHNIKTDIMNIIHEPILSLFDYVLRILSRNSKTLLKNIKINGQEINKEYLAKLEKLLETNNEQIFDYALKLIEGNYINENNINNIYTNIKQLLQNNDDLIMPLIQKIQELNDRTKLFSELENLNKNLPLKKQDYVLQEIKNIIVKNRNKKHNNVLKLSSFDDDNIYLDQNCVMHMQNFAKINKIKYTKDFLIILYDNRIDLKRIITAHNNQYELIGIQLSNDKHSISFVKTGKSDSSWSGVDSNRNANDHNYKLEDIFNNNINLNNERSEYDYQCNRNYYSDVSKNKYLAKVYEHYGYAPDFLLYKKISYSKLPSNRQNTIKNNSQ